jgi:hypothetical protein
MAKTVKAYFVEKGMASELAVQLDEVASAMYSRIRRFNKKGVTKNLIMVDLGKYRHLETRSPGSLQEMTRQLLDAMLLVVNFEDRFRILEHADIIKFNYATAEYEFTEFGKQFVGSPGA